MLRVTIGATPIAGAGSNGVIDCSSPTTSLSGTGGGTYSWVLLAVVILPLDQAQQHPL